MAVLCACSICVVCAVRPFRHSVVKRIRWTRDGRVRVLARKPVFKLSDESVPLYFRLCSFIGPPRHTTKGKVI